MSYTTIYKVPSAGAVEYFAKFHNASRGAPMLWDYLGHKYIPGYQGLFNKQDEKNLWALADDARLAEYERDVFLSTFDGAMVKRQHFWRLADAMDRIGHEMTRLSGGFGEAEIVEPDGGHYLEHAATLRRMLGDSDILAACWNQTSVCQNPWLRHDQCESCGQDLEDLRPFDFSRGDTGHWFMFEGLTSS